MNWLGFLAVANAWWLLLLVPLWVFYFLKLKRPRVEISSLALWQSVVSDQRVNSPFQRFRRNILLWLQIAILVLVVVAAMQPFIRGSAEQAEYQPILIDCSASMAAKDQLTGQSRLDAAKQRVTDLIDSLKPGQQLSLIAVHSSADQLTEFTGNRRVLLKALDALRVQDVPSQLEDALRMTQALAKTAPVETAVMFSDGNVPDRVHFALPFRLNFQQLPQAGANAGITAFNARLTSAQEWDVFLRIESSADSAGHVELKQDGLTIGEQPFVLGRNESQRLSFRVVAEAATELEAHLVVNRADYDSLETDNTAWLGLPVARPLRVFASPSLPGFRRALSTMPEVDVYPKNKQTSQRSAPYDLVISDQEVDSELVAAMYLMIGVIPDDADTLLESDDRLNRFRDWDRTTPLLRHVQLRDVEIVDALVSGKGNDGSGLEELGYETLATGSGGPLILRKRTSSSLFFYTLFHTTHSTLEYRVAFPVLVANVVYLARQESSLGDIRALKTGSHPVIMVEPETACILTRPDGSNQKLKSDQTGRVAGISVNRVGQYRVEGDAVRPLSFAANLLSSEETVLKPVDSIHFDERSVASTDETLETDRPLWEAFVLIGFAGLLIEWWYFQRPGSWSVETRSRK